MKLISLENVVLYHEKIISATGGSLGIRDIGLIESALSRGIASFDGKDLYKTDIEKISAITYSLINNHAFIDGNKRIGVSVMLLLLRINNVNLSYAQEELINLGLSIAENKSDIFDIAKWILDHRV
ncbi:type II toxin-antitoxin system death-on-curing family toxin [Paramaledivibacter caminithermalis]|uniref:Death on curing protein n=1 Tax=Paramaledivibacter caminithermalis (strain DSM 15212 / CIP 107654 / DViRD3) TaxID=1121301 RepID=A0A1M6QHU2_PARC5|nr:type II toxin-antitoxin system death-on-curing family toxin [Paramaledivibacter caminithermalis]SHK19587.1 death on curing protein [Paramaledivibacter caminithermalis DSM 15212]